MDAASAATLSTSLYGVMTPSMKASLDLASKASVTGLTPAHQRILDNGLANSTLGGLGTPAMSEAIDKYAARPDIVSLGKELARSTVVDLVAGQAFAGSALAKEVLAKESLGSKLAEVTRIASRHQRIGASGVAPDFVRLITEGSPASQTLLNSEIYQLAVRALPSHGHFSLIRNQSDLEKVQKFLPGAIAPRDDLSAAMMPTGGVGALGTALLAAGYKHQVADYRRWRGEGAASAFDALGLSSKAITALGLKAEASPSVLALTAAGLTSEGKGLAALRRAMVEPIVPSPPPVPEPRSVPARPLPSRRDHEVAPVAASFFAGEDRRMVITMLETAGLEAEREHLEALEERLRTGHAPARNHAAVSARQLLLGVANHVFPAKGEARPCRLGCSLCPHPLGYEQVMNRLIAFVDEQLAGKLNTHELKVFLAQADYVYRWGGRGTHENLSRTEAVRAFVRLLEVLAMVARAYGIQSPGQPC